MKATLVLENGSSFEGIATGAAGDRCGRVIMNTAVVGYQEMMTDPANAGKILVLTYPLIGNYGVAEKFLESPRPWINGLVVKEESRIYSNWQAKGPFGGWTGREGVLAMSDVDTRTLTIEIRDHGEMFGIISTESSDKGLLLKKVKDYARSPERGWIKKVSTQKVTEAGAARPCCRMAVLDLGIPNSSLKQLKTLGCGVTLLSYNTDAAKIMALRPDGVIVSSGPEDDEAMPEIAATVKALLGKVPLLGISLGHEIIGLALGCRLKSMKVGHRGVNYPVKGEGSYKGEVTVQNHSYIVDDDSLKGKRGVSVTLRNVNDGSIEEMESKPLKFISAQYYPASPGFDEVNTLFRRFLKMSGAGKASKEVEYAKA